MINLLIAIDLEVKFARMQTVDEAFCRLTAQNPADMRRLAVYLYKMFPNRLLHDYEVEQTTQALRMHHIAHAMVA